MLCLWKENYQTMISFQQTGQRKCPTPYPKDNLEEEDIIHQDQVNKVQHYRVIHLASYPPVLLYFPKVPTRIVG